MVDRRTNSLVMEVKIHYDDMKRVTTRENNYYYTAIDDTPFRYKFIKYFCQIQTGFYLRITRTMKFYIHVNQLPDQFHYWLYG